MKMCRTTRWHTNAWHQATGALQQMGRDSSSCPVPGGNTAGKAGPKFHSKPRLLEIWQEYVGGGRKEDLQMTECVVATSNTKRDWQLTKEAEKEKHSRNVSSSTTTVCDS
ncbi:hypothetical protein JZ751_017340 [Albula glossodonta]|uniref:Uncharacterized protein n=1 Tax=Albula glossodonta TaxID=121402 RepID=A0A8T2PJM3_9TELE|nr:hypothetical protein JZ751_017340 [Albula glossodonta]